MKSRSGLCAFFGRPIYRRDKGTNLEIQALERAHKRPRAPPLFSSSFLSLYRLCMPIRAAGLEGEFGALDAARVWCEAVWPARVCLPTRGGGLRRRAAEPIVICRDGGGLGGGFIMLRVIRGKCDFVESSLFAEVWGAGGYNEVWAKFKKRIFRSARALTFKELRKAGLKWMIFLILNFSPTPKRIWWSEKKFHMTI